MNSTLLICTLLKTSCHDDSTPGSSLSREISAETGEKAGPEGTGLQGPEGGSTRHGRCKGSLGAWHKGSLRSQGRRGGAEGAVYVRMYTATAVQGRRLGRQI